MTPPLRPGSLLCEYRENPLGIDVLHPRLSWSFDSSERGGKQQAYQILSASSYDLLDRNTGDLWDTGNVQSSQTIHIPYAGKPLASAQQVWWKVRTSADWSESANFTMGLLNQSDWQASWITPNPENYISKSLPLFRREFNIQKKLTRAIVFICGLGHFELHLNGQIVGQNVLDPGWTDYRKKILYVTHDVTPLIRQGGNAIGVILGNGMYRITSSSRYKKFKAVFGPLKFILQIHLTFEDGPTEILTSDDSWKVAPSPVAFSCIYGGEDYDAHQEQPGWDLPNFRDAGWQTAKNTYGAGGILTSQSAPPVRVMKTLEAIHVSKIADDIAIYDLGQNFSGWPEVTITGEAGSVKLITGELLDHAGRVSQKSSGSPVFFTHTSSERSPGCTSGATRTWNPQFAYTGFRYVEAQGNINSIEKLTGQFIHSSASVVGKFHCSNPLFNDIHHLINNAILSNMQSVLTDCPHREKLGWLEQTHLMGPAIMFNYDVPLLYRKICDDMRDAQQSDGCVPTIAPEYTKFTGHWADFSNSPEWGSAAVICPWLVYQQYGDQQILLENFEMMHAYVNYLHYREQNGIIDFGLGDWYDIGPGDPGYSKLTSKALTATAIYYLDLQILEKTARLLSKAEEAEHYASHSRQVKQAFQSRFFDEKSGQYDQGSQAANGMALALGLVDRAHESRVLGNLIRDIRARKNHITAGDIGFRFVLDALSQAGRSDVIFDLLSQTDPPSYGAQLRQGATTLTEAWDANPEKSQNHLMLGHAELWFYQSLAGIHLDLSKNDPNRIVIQPAIVGDIRWAEASYESILGRISSRWDRQGTSLTLSIEIPFNTSATVHLPDGSTRIVEAGKYSFASDLKTMQ